MMNNTTPGGNRRAFPRSAPRTPVQTLEALPRQYNPEPSEYGRFGYQLLADAISIRRDVPLTAVHDMLTGSYDVYDEIQLEA